MKKNAFVVYTTAVKKENFYTGKKYKNQGFSYVRIIYFLFQVYVFMTMSV